MKKRIVSIHGSYFGINYGDILLVNLFSRWVKNVAPEIQINLPLVNNQKITEIPENSISGLGNLIRSDKLIFCGGGYFGEKPSRKYRWALRNFMRHGIVGIIALVFRIPYIFVGVEFGPITARWFRLFTIFLTKHAERIIVRNQESKEFLESYGVKNVELAVDAVLTLSDEVLPIDTSKNNTKYILLHLSHVAKYEEGYKTFIQTLSKYIKTHIKDYKLSLIFDNPENLKDYEYIQNIITENGLVSNNIEYTDTKTLINIINSASYVFTSKLHVGITAAALNKPVFSLYAHPKTPRLHRQINNIKFCMPIQSISEIGDGQLYDFFMREKYVLPHRCLDDARENKRAVEEFIKE